MDTELRREDQRRFDWLPRSVMAGFSAGVIMLVAFFASFVLIRAIAGVELADRRGAAEFHMWIRALIDNRVIDLGASSLYLAGVLHLVMGVLVAIVYAYIAEPRLPGPGWVRGMMFALIPWLVSVLVFLPLVGAGWFGVDLGAGPLPALGNLVLHFIYGATLGEIYGPLGDRPADGIIERVPGDDPRVVMQYERGAAAGIVIGATIGIVLTAIGLRLVGETGSTELGLPWTAWALAGVTVGAAFGGMLGSFAGLAASRQY